MCCVRIAMCAKCTLNLCVSCLLRRGWRAWVFPRPHTSRGPAPLHHDPPPSYLVPSWYLAIWISCEYAFSTVMLLFFFNLRFYLLVIRGVSSLIIAQTQVSSLLNSQPVEGYRKGGATFIVHGVHLSMVVGTCRMWAWNM